MMDHELHNYIPVERFQNTLPNSAEFTVPACTGAVPVEQPRPVRLCSEIKRIIDRVRNHTCGLSSFSDMPALFQLSRLWNNEAHDDLTDVVQQCAHCLAASTPPLSKKAALATLNRSFNDLLFVEHFHLDTIRIFHIMDSNFGFSTASIVAYTSLSAAVTAFES